MNPNELRGTGRTTRMIDEAIREAEACKIVYVLVGFDSDLDTIFWKIADKCGGKEWEVAPSILKINYWKDKDSFGSIFVATAYRVRFDWDMMRCRTLGPDTVYLVDHRTIESRFSDVLDMLHRWDDRPRELLPTLPELLQGGDRQNPS